MLGSYLAFQFGRLLPWSVGLASCGAVAGLSLALGYRDRTAAIVSGFVLACLAGRNPLIADAALPILGWLLLAHLLLPPAPFGTIAARGRLDPGGGWRMPAPIFIASWVVLAIVYSYDGYTRLVNPLPSASPLGGMGLELLFAPLALLRRARPWIWLAAAGMQFTILLSTGSSDIASAMLLLHAFAFDPSWIAPAGGNESDTVFYDGHCGLCHGFVRFLLAEDEAGHRFTFAPLDGASFVATVSEEERDALPDSVVIRTDDGRLLVRTAAVRRVLERLGGGWRVLALASRLLPRALTDALYDRVAAVRRLLVRAPSDSCPRLPQKLRCRFRDSVPATDRFEPGGGGE